MKPLTGFVLGSIVGAVAVALRGTQIVQHTRPVAKAALKAALAAMHEAHVRQAEIVEAAEDLLAETAAEVEAEKLATAMAAAEAKVQEASDAFHEAQARQAEIVAAVGKLYAEAKGEVTPERLAAVIAAAEARAREAQDTGKAGQAMQSSAEPVVDISSLKRPQATRYGDGS